MSSLKEPSIRDIYNALTGLLNTQPGHSPARNQSIAYAELVVNLIETDGNWRAVLNGEQTEIEKKAARYDFLVDSSLREGVPSSVMDSLAGCGGHPDDVIDDAMTGDSKSVAPRG